MPSLQFPIHQSINPDTPVLSGTVTITGIEPASTPPLEISVAGEDIQKDSPIDGVNQVSIQPVMEDPGVVIYDLQFVIAESLQSQWRFNPLAAQFFVNEVPAGVLFPRFDDFSVKLKLFTNLPEGPESLARYQISLGFLSSSSSTPVWIDDPTVILKPPTG